MGAIRPPKRAKLFCGLLSGDIDLLAEARRRLRQHFGEVELESEIWPFVTTDYYEAELGTDVKRQFVFFRDLVSVEMLADIKRQTNDLELKLCEDLMLPTSTRPVNMDPGYLTLSKIVLATTKDHAHRIYLQRGIYAEVTLRFHDGQWAPWPWTYPDYAATTYHPFFIHARQALKQTLAD